MKTIHFDDEVIEIVDSYPAFKKPRLPIQGEQEVIDLTNLLIETPSVLDDGEIEKNLASQSLKSTGCINSTDQLQATTQAYSCAASTSSFQQLLLNESVESLMEKIKRIVSQADPTLKTEKILRGLQNSFNKLKKDYRDSKDFHKMLLDVKADMEKKDVFGCLKALFTELKLHRDENIEGEAKTDDPQLRLKKSLIKNAQKVIKNEKNLIEKWEKCEKVRKFLEIVLSFLMC